MNSSRKFKAFLGFNWQWYLIIFLAVCLLFYYLFISLRTPGYDERVNVFVASSNVETDKLAKELYVGFDDTPIKEVSIDFSSPKGNDFSIVFNTRATVNTDIIIMNTSYINQGDYDKFFIGFAWDIIADYVPTDCEFYYDSDGLIYGICVSDYLKDYVNLDGEEIYLFFNKNSEKIAELSDKSENNYALIVLKNICERMVSNEKN